ncbi:MAG: helix-turn-helix domain-containing protein [Roseburia sp.]|uniref:XRE family transcriptional regulator n=1 Tax=Roseburia inulinivorans TaxID=360807 RepID=A0A414LZB8_9FIRM|nr:helix-turn-helix transcriptional regulator [Roseburia inulinivorans]MBS5419325.1 helix-turn-helix domain-containing protein [Roseburia sp.]RHF00395.1 XRE family transcriptional regulator [Roseburia inulinivorans]
MKETKVYPQSEADQDFAKLLKNIRTEENVSLDQLAMGLMSASQLVKIENGERPINKNIRDRLLERLGIAKELYENLLDLCDFEEWDYKKKILSAIQNKKIEDAYRLLKEYKAHLRENDRINHQFILAMWGEVLKQEGASKEKIAECYRKAVILTIPDAEKVWSEKRPLSVLEMNLLLETIIYGNNMDYLHKCRVLMEYIDTGYYDEIMKAKIYPKIVYYYLKKQILFKEYWNVETQTENLKICEKAIDKLRDAGRTYYLVELLEIEIQILETMPEDAVTEHLEKNETDKINARELISVIKNLYAEYEVPAYMQDCTYFYQQKWIFSMKDVLRTRRAMFGLTQEQLCEGICSVKSLRRAEKGQTDMQRETLKKLLNRLGLSGQMQWSRLITSDREVIRMAEELADYINDRKFSVASKQLESLKSRIDLDIPQNKQYFLEKQALLEFEQGKVTREEFVKMEKEALECTLCAENLYRKENVYLTEREIICISNSWKGMEGKQKRESINLILRLYDYYALNNGLSQAISVYEIVTEAAVNELGNNGEHVRAEEIDRKSIKASLSCRRVWDIHYKIYDILWNEKKLMKKSGKRVSNNRMNTELKRCIIMSHYVKRYFYENVYKEKLS